jgi:excisionase family DNA binding protein
VREDRERRVERRRSVNETAKTTGASRSPVHSLKGSAAETRGEDDVTRLIRIIARQAAQEAFTLFRDALEGRAVEDLPLLDSSKLQRAQEGQAGKDRGSPEPGDRFLSVAEIANKFGISEKTVRRKIASGDWPADRVGKLIRVSERVLTVHVIRARF